jgi:hypothetical protein
MNQSDTPRSNHWLSGYDDNEMTLDAFRVMQQLETELSAARKEIEGLHYALKQASTIYDAVIEQRDRLAEALDELYYDRSDKAVAMANEALQYLTIKRNE